MAFVVDSKWNSLYLTASPTQCSLSFAALAINVCLQWNSLKLNNRIFIFVRQQRNKSIDIEHCRCRQRTNYREIKFPLKSFTKYQFIRPNKWHVAVAVCYFYARHEFYFDFASHYCPYVNKHSWPFFVVFRWIGHTKVNSFHRNTKLVTAYRCGWIRRGCIMLQLVWAMYIFEKDQPTPHCNAHKVIRIKGMAIFFIWGSIWVVIFMKNG